jgi:hypothetical protein
MPFANDFPRLRQQAIPEGTVSKGCNAGDVQLYIPYKNFQPLEFSAKGHREAHCFYSKENLDMYRTVIGNISTLPPDWRLDFAFQLHCLCRQPPNKALICARKLKDELLEDFAQSEWLRVVDYGSCADDDTRDRERDLGTATYTVNGTTTAEDADDSCLTVQPTLWKLGTDNHLHPVSETTKAPWYRVM